MPPPPTPSIKLTLEGLATLLGLKVCSHGDLGFAFGSGPVLTSHETATVIREVVANLRTRAREEGEAAESLRAQLGETSAALAEVTEILHRAWPEHKSGDPVQLARAATEAIVSSEAMRAEALAEGRERAKADELEIRQLTESLRVARSAESARAEEVDTLLKMIDALAPGLPSCVEPHSDRLAHAQRKIAAALDAVEHTEDPIELQEEPLRVFSPIHKLRRGSAQASGLDLPVRLGVSLAPGRTVRIPTGVQVAIPEGLEGQVRPRSSAAARGLLIHLGTIDADYRGEIEVVVTNLSGEWAAIDKPIAQLVICPVARPSIEYVEKLNDTTRGEGGFGSSDVIASGGYTNGAMVVVGKETK